MMIHPMDQRPETQSLEDNDGLWVPEELPRPGHQDPIMVNGAATNRHSDLEQISAG